AAIDVFHDDVMQLLFRHRVIDLADVRVLQLAGERGFGEKQFLVQPCALGVLEVLGEGDLDRDIAIVERVVALVDLGGRALAELSPNRVLADLAETRLGAHPLPRRLRARAAARRTCTGAVPPTWLRAATAPSASSTRRTSAPICGEKRFSVASGSRARSVPRRSASRTARATTSCASRNATPLRTR